MLLAGAYLVAHFHGIPAYNYYQAEQALQQKDYDRAKAAFLKLEDYRDAPQMALEADYQKAEGLAEKRHHHRPQKRWEPCTPR